MAAKNLLLDDALELAELLKPAWAQISESIPASHPRNEGDDGEGDGAGSAGAADGDDTDAGDDDGADGADTAGDAGDGGSGGSDDIDWKAMARRHERRAKQEKKDREALAAKLKEFEERDQTDQEKALAKAREDAASEVTTKYETERRAERLELAVTRQATKGVKVGDGDDAKTVRFADPDDALAHLERAIKRGEIDGDDIFDDDGKVQKDALGDALVELLNDKPHLAAKADGNGAGRAAGDADAGRGRALSADDESVDDHFKRIRRAKT